MDTKTSYKVADIKHLIKESANELKAKIGDGVESTEKKQNKEAYATAKKRAQDFDGGLKKELGGSDVKFEKEDNNRTLLDYNIAGADDKFKKRVKTQVLGYTSELEQNNGIEKEGDYSGNKKIYDALTKSAGDYHKEKKEFNKSGLQSREWDDKTFKEDKDEMFEHKVRTARFKKTRFLNEDHMRRRIPEEFKKNGTKFKMIDRTGNTYLCEWEGKQAVVLKHKDDYGVNEAFDRMKSLMNYKPEDTLTKTTRNQRINENKSVSQILETMRKLK